MWEELDAMPWYEKYWTLVSVTVETLWGIVFAQEKQTKEISDWVKAQPPEIQELFIDHITKKYP